MGRIKCDVTSLLQEECPLRICAPMVRYSKLEFRSLVRKYGSQLCFTPMIMANSFIQSQAARRSEFTTNEGDSPLVVQFAANAVEDFVQGSQLVYPYCDGVDLNCGCPQRWAMKDGYGADLLSKPHLIKDMVYQVRNKVNNPFSVSIKIRINEDIRKTVSLCQAVEAAGVSFITVHGRTVKQRNESPNMEAIRTIVDSLQIPVIANGDIKSLSELRDVCDRTGTKGGMVADALLRNPGLFTGYEVTPNCIVSEWISLWLAAASSSAINDLYYQTFHHHLVFMLEKRLTRQQRQQFNYLTTIPDVVEYLKDALDLPVMVASSDYLKASNLTYDHHIPPGSYFTTIKYNLENSEDLLDGSIGLFGD